MLFLYRDGRDVATWQLHEPPAGTATVEFGDDVQHTLVITTTPAPTPGDPDRVITTGSIGICGPDVVTPLGGDVVITDDDTLGWVFVNGIPRADERIQLRNRR
jgi:hypothetical protein